MNIAELDQETFQEEFDKMMARTAPFDYGKQMMDKHWDRVKAILCGKLVPPYELEIQPSARCNVKCKHCFGSDLGRLEDKIGWMQMTTLADDVVRFKDNGFRIETIKFCGTTGDPLVNPYTGDAIRLFKSIDRDVIIFTNGLALMDELNGIPNYYNCAFADKVNLSLDAGSPEVFKKVKRVDGFNRVISGLRNLVIERDKLGKDSRITVSYVITKDNYQDVENAAEVAKEAGADDISYRVDFRKDSGIPDISDKIVERIEKVSARSNGFKIGSVYSEEDIKRGDLVSIDGFHCFNHNFWACVGPDFEVYPCGHRTYQGASSYGSLFDSSLRDIIAGTNRCRFCESLPDKYCWGCSPSSKSRNIIMSLLTRMDAISTGTIRTPSGDIY